MVDGFVQQKEEKEITDGTARISGNKQDKS